MLLLSFFVCHEATIIGVGSLGQPGPGLLAFGSGLAMGGLALCLLIQSFVSKERRQGSAEPGTALKSSKLLMLCTSLFVYTIAVSRIGFVISTFLFVVFILRLVESKGWWRPLLAATLITIGTYLTFVVWLDVSLPSGFLPW